MLRVEDRRRAQALSAALLLMVACGDDAAPRDPADAGRDTAPPAPDAGPPGCRVACFEVMPGEWRTECVDETGAGCEGAYPRCDREMVSEPDRDRTFLVPQCLAPTGSEARAPYCGTTTDGEPAFGHAPIVDCAEPEP